MKFTPEMREKAKATEAAQKELFASQVVKIGDDWIIRRADEYNWEIQYKGKFQGFYGNLRSAFQTLPDKMLNMTPFGGENPFGRLLDAQKGIIDKIEDALFDARTLTRKMQSHE